MAPRTDGDSRSTVSFRRILLIEGEIAHCQAVVDFLEQHGSHVKRVLPDESPVEQVRHGHFDLVLVDVERPLLKSREIAQAIRQLPRPQSDVPMIAISSQSNAAERQAYLQAGFNGFLLKPIDIRDLRALFESPLRTAAVPIMNRESALVRLGGDAKLLRQLADFYAEDAPKLLRELEAALAADDAKLVHQTAHSLKGLAANFDAFAAVTAARDMELAAHAGNLQACPSLLDSLRSEIARLIEALAALR
jgi:two-component system, sensor histidine kinase and response regulator